MAGRELELADVSAFLTDATSRPRGLLIRGDAGIGKTTLWQRAREEAAARGFRVLSAQCQPSEIRMAFAGLADLLDDVEAAVIDGLPPVLRGALDRVLLRGDASPAMDERAAAAAFRGVLQRLSTEAPVLVAIDDIQWLDVSSAVAVRFAARRLDGPIGVVATARTGGPSTADGRSWLTLPSPDAVTYLTMPPLTLTDLHVLLADRLGHVPSRPTMMRIHEISGGNPLFALELARAVKGGHDIERQLPSTLGALVQARLKGVDTQTRQLLLAAACTPNPTVDVVAAATGTLAPRVADTLESGEAARIVAITGNRIRFHHPLLASGVYTGASTRQRRALHRQMADCVEPPELRARHLAAAAVSGDASTLAALDAAAGTARARGAPAASAELLEMAISLGGGTPQRRIQAAEHHFRAGSLAPARQLLLPTIDGLPPGLTRCLALMLLGAVQGYGDDTAGAVQTLTQAAHEAPADTEVRLHCLLRLVLATVMTGHVSGAVDHARAAVTLADRLDVPRLRSRALSVSVAVGFVHGLGVDRAALETALALEDRHDDATSWYRASAAAAMICAWAGDLHSARRQMLDVHRRMLDGAAELDVIWAANHLATIDVWLGRYADAEDASREAVQRAEQMGGRHLLVTAWGWAAAVAAYTGREAEARSAAGAAIGTAREIGAPYLIEGPAATLAFLEVSLGNYAAALEVVAPLLAVFEPQHTEIVTGAYLPDAIEALANAGCIDEAERLVNALQDNGSRHSRPWMLAMAARGRALCLAARGDLPGAELAALAALDQHRQLPMPFETARTQLVLGQLQRRRRRGRDAHITLSEALSTFERLGTPLWIERSRAERDRVGPGDRSRTGLTPAERRIAGSAAAGLSNKEIAVEHFVSVKTVEVTLSNVYRKLGIRSRSQLHPHISGDRPPQ